jgi:predicted MFS family arabinose efflux permease
MMKKLRGRNLAHPGCLIGVTVGLTIGIVLGEILAAAFKFPLNAVLLTWLGLTVVLGAIGWMIGDRLSSRFPALEEEADENQSD